MNNCSIFALIVGTMTVAAFYYFLWHRRCKNYWKERGIPQVSGLLPIFGNVLPLITLKYSIFGLAEKYYKEYSNYSMVGFFDMHTPALLLRDPELVKTVMQTEFSNFYINSFPLNAENDPLLLKNPFFTDGEAWSTSRKRLTFAFSGIRLKSMSLIVCSICDKFNKYIDKQLENTEVLEISTKDLFGRFTGEGVAMVGFGVEGNCFEESDGSESFMEIGKRLFDISYWKAILLNLMFFVPLLSKLLRVSFLEEDANTFFRNVVRNVISARRKEEIKRNDFFQMMVDFEKSEGEQIDEDALASHAVSFFLDGFETSRITLSFLAFHLATNSEVQKKLRAEVLSVLSNYDNIISYDALKDMTYMDQVVNESLRITPSVGAFMKTCSKETVLNGFDGLSIKVKKGTEILIPVTELHVEPKYWANPTIFDVERFSVERKSEIKKCSFLPFGEGPRTCVGMTYALLQVKACLTQFIRNYSVQVSPKTQIPLKMDPTYFLPYPIGGIWIYVKRFTDE